MKTTSKSGLKLNTGIRAGGLSPQHNRRGLTIRVRTAIRAGFGDLQANHTRTLIAAA